MNEIRRHDREAEEIARIREIVGRHALPDFVTGFEVKLGDIDGDPALWVVFRTVERPDRSEAALNERVAQLQSLRRSTRADLLQELQDRFPYIRFEPAIQQGPRTH